MQSAWVAKQQATRSARRAAWPHWSSDANAHRQHLGRDPPDSWRRASRCSPRPAPSAPRLTASTSTAAASRSSTPTAPSRSTCRPGRPTSSSSAAPSTGRCARPSSLPRHGTVEVDLPLQRWINLPEQGWYAGNTHIHYDENETRALDRLRLDPRVEDLPVFIVSVLKRRELAYASNAFPIGRHALSTPEHVIDVGEESRHNDEPWRIGYGHIMLVNIQQLVEPMSRGVLVDDASPDYPPLVDACDGARDQGGLVLWCHNAKGMEAPVAAILGKLDGINLFDPWWLDPEYEIWYRLLNCGLRLPASTGSDWFLCSSNRVYNDVAGTFSYETLARRAPSGADLHHRRADPAAPGRRPRAQQRPARPVHATTDRRGRRRVGGHPARRPRRDRPRRRGRLRRRTTPTGRWPAASQLDAGRRRGRLGRRPLLGQPPQHLRPPALGAHQPRLPPSHPRRAHRPRRRRHLRRAHRPDPRLDLDPRPLRRRRPSATACSSSTPRAAPPSTASPARRGS